MDINSKLHITLKKTGWNCTTPLPYLVVALSLLLFHPARAAVSLPDGFAEDKLIPSNSLGSPTGMVFAPDGRIFVTEKFGAVRVIKNGTLLPTPFLTMFPNAENERGLLGITLDPNFAQNGFVYLYYAANLPAVHNRVSRFTANGNLVLPGSELILLELNNLNALIHNGSAMGFGKDGKLYIATGENSVPANAQSLNSLLGKILRINADGSIPTDNPYYSTATGQNRAIWALGLRNPFSMNFQPGTGRLFVNDVGNNRWEEVNEVSAGANFGWPATEGYTSNSSYRNPVFAYPHGAGQDAGCAISGGAFYNPQVWQFPENYAGKYFYVDFCNQWINVLDPDSGYSAHFASGTLGNTVKLAVGPDGSLYFLNYTDGSISRISYSGMLRPLIRNQPESLLVPAGYPAAFEVSASATSLTYQWFRGGVPIPNATLPEYLLPVTTLADNGATFSCVVTNPNGSATSDIAVLSVIADRPPVPRITSPASTVPDTAIMLFSGGDTIAFAGDALDAEDGELTASALTWWVGFHHHPFGDPAHHEHPFLGPFEGSFNGSFTVPISGETADDVWFRVNLMATDSDGISSQTYRDIFPRKATITLATVPPGLKADLDGESLRTPLSTIGVSGITRTLGIPPPQTFNGEVYDFASWSDGGAREHAISTPATNKTFTATFRKIAAIDNAAFVAQIVPLSMVAGETYKVSVTFENSGTTTWKAGSQVRLSAQNPRDTNRWGLQRVVLLHDVSPEELVTFEFNVTAPTLEGDYASQWQMVRDGVARFGFASTNLVIRVRRAANAAAFVSQTVPTAMTPGLRYNVSVTMRNVGINTWTAATNYHLGSWNLRDNLSWGTRRVDLPNAASVGPGGTVTISFPVTAPGVAGSYNFQWHLLQEGVGWFGDASQNVAVQVGPANGAAFISQSALPPTMNAGQLYPVSITLQNTGTRTWLRSAKYFLGSQMPQDGRTWGLNRVTLPQDVAPGTRITVPFTVIAPSIRGLHAFQWQMVQEGVGWFGARTLPLSITVN